MNYEKQAQKIKKGDRVWVEEERLVYWGGNVKEIDKKKGVRVANMDGNEGWFSCNQLTPFPLEMISHTRT